MNDRQFDELLDSVRDMGRHRRGELVDGVRVQELCDPDVEINPDALLAMRT